MIKIGEFDYFLIEVTNMEDKNDYELLKNLCRKIALKSEVIDYNIKYKERKALIEVKNSSKAIFLMHLIYKEFKPWVLIKGIKKLFKSDFPKEIFGDDFLPKKWNSKLNSIIHNLVH